MRMQDPIGLRGGWNRYINNPVQYIDALGLKGFGIGVSPTGQAAESAGRYLSESDREGALSAISGPYYAPMSGSISVDLSYAFDFSMVGNDSYGLAAGGAFTGTISGGSVSSGESDLEGWGGAGGWLGKFGITAMKDSAGNKSGSLGAGPGAGAFVGKITCHQSTKCAFD